MGSCPPNPPKRRNMTSTTRFLVALAIAAGLLPAARAQAAGPPSPGATDLNAIVSGKMYSRAALAYQNGEFSDYRVFGIGAILVRHPAGMLLFDSGFGQQVDEHIKTMPLLMRWLSPHEKCVPVARQLAQNGIGLSSLKAVVLTHAHWDHVSGLADLPDVPVGSAKPSWPSWAVATTPPRWRGSSARPVTTPIASTTARTRGLTPATMYLAMAAWCWCPRRDTRQAPSSPSSP